MKETFLLYGFRRGESGSNVSMLVDADMDEAHAKAEQIAGKDYKFHASELAMVPIPDSAKNKLFHSDEELYAAVPDLNPRRRRKRK